jgi:predicted phosphodiesterase
MMLSANSEASVAREARASSSSLWVDIERDDSKKYAGADASFAPSGGHRDPKSGGLAAARVVQCVCAAVLLRRALVIAGVLGSLFGCVQTTPYDVDSEHSDFNQQSLAKLRARGAPPQPFRFVAVGDTHDEYDDFDDLIDVLNAQRDLELITHTGDISDRGLLQEMEWSIDLLERIEIPVLVTLGNHDAISHGADIWRTMFGPFDYSFHFGGLKFVFFNSNALEFPGKAPNREWLQNQIAERGDAQGVVLVSHHPPDTGDDIPGGTTKGFYAELLASGGIDLWIHGHDRAPRLLTYYGVPVLGAGTFEVGRDHWIVTAGGAEFSFERCRFAFCKRMFPTESLP